MPSEYVVRWTGGRIGLGASVFHFQGTNSPSAAQAAANAIRTFFIALGPSLPTGVQVAFDPEVRVLDASGVLTAVIPVTTPVTITGTGSGAWTNGAGAMVRWSTPSIVAGRRLLGRTYLVPLVASAFTTGNVNATVQGTINTAAAALISSLSGNGTPLQVWSKKNAVVADVLTGAVPSRPATLRSRNDRD